MCVKKYMIIRTTCIEFSEVCPILTSIKINVLHECMRTKLPFFTMSIQCSTKFMRCEDVGAGKHKRSLSISNPQAPPIF